MAPLRIGVVIGRFQVPQLHEGHKQLLKEVRDRSDFLVVLLGVSGLDILGRKFGTTINDKGYRVLDPHVRVIQGDGVDPVSIDKILAVLEINGWSADNVAFGMGGALLQKVNRDTCRFAFKCSEVTVDGVDRPVYKNPVGDPSKASKSGPLSTYRADDGSWFCAPPDGRSGTEMMREVYRNGRVRITDTMDDIRSRARAI